jgi:hypothetical protein
MQWAKDIKGVIRSHKTKTRQCNVLWLLITPLVSFAHCIVWSLCYSFWLTLWYLLPIALSGLRFMASDYPFDIFCPLHCLVFVLWLLITHLVSFAHCIVWSSCYGFWLTLWYLLLIALSGLCFMASDYPFGIFCPLHCLVFVLWLLITPLVSFAHCIVWSSEAIKRRPDNAMGNGQKIPKG